MTEVCTPATSTISTATFTRQSESSSMSLNHVCITLYQLSARELKYISINPQTPLTCFCHKGRKEQRYWNGHNAVFVVLLGSTAVLPCTNRRSVWTDWSDQEEDQQVFLLVSRDRSRANICF